MRFYLHIFTYSDLFRLHYFEVFFLYSRSIKEEGRYVMNKKQTSNSVATKASQILRDGRYGSKTKSVAGSALAQTKTGKKK